MRILHGPVNVGNQPWGVSRAERKLNHRSDVVVNYSTWLKLPADRELSEYANKSPGSILRRLAFSLSSPFRYDVMHYYFGRSFLCWDDYSMRTSLWFKDLQLAKLLRRTTVMTLQGCDVRLSAESAANNQWTPCSIDRCNAAETCRSKIDRERRWLIENILPHIDRIFFLNPELGHFTKRGEFLPYASVEPNEFEVQLPSTRLGPIRILHAPSDESIKGSQLIYEAIDTLKARYDIEFVTIKGMPHEDAIRRYHTADLVIDQVLAGWYGAFAVECMAMGKPVACYIREKDRQHLPDAMYEDLPIIKLDPSNIASGIETAIRDRRALDAIGRRSREFVEKWHDPTKIAEGLLKVYEDTTKPFHIRGT